MIAPDDLMKMIANHLWQSTLVAAAAWLITLALSGNRARVRQAVWFAASLKFLIPFSMLVALGARIEWRPAPATASANLSIVMDQFSKPFSSSAAIVPALPKQPRRSNPWPRIVALFWAAGTLAIGVVWLIRWRRMWNLAAAAAPIELPVPIPAISSPALMEPGVFGVFQPVLLLPEGIRDRLTAEQFEAVIEHELCHVRHRDNLFAAIQMFIETIFWFHPLVWFIGKRMIAERERACDEAVLSHGSEPRVYAEAILNVCKWYVESPLECVAGVTGAGLKERIQTILENRAANELTRAQKLLLASAAFAAVFAPIAIGLINAPALRAQSSNDQSSKTWNGPIPKWEAVAIKPCDGSGPAGRSGGGTGSQPPSPDRVRINCAVPMQLIQEAYGFLADGRSPNWNHIPIEGGRAWLNSERYSIEAKAESAQGHAMLFGPMMQTILEDRFKLKIRRETRQVPVYELTVVKGGPKNLKPSTPDSCVPLDMGFPPPPKPGVEVCELIGRGVMRGATSGSFSAFGMTMPKFAEGLSSLLDRNVIDKTGISGKFDINVPIPLEDLSPPPESSRPDRPFLNYRDDEMVFSAMRQLGMKLEPAKGPGEFLVIEHVERPTDNFTPPAPKPEPSPIARMNAKPAPQQNAIAAAAAQSSAQSVERPAQFEAASVKPHPDGVRNRTRSTEPGRITALDVSLGELISVAYGLKPYQISGPDWIVDSRSSATYDVIATAGKAVPAEEIRRMLQPLLAERFHLVFHRETKELPVFALVVAKGGPKFKEPGDGGDQAIRPDSEGGLSFKNLSMDELAEWFSRLPSIERPVIDRTGLAGAFSFRANLFGLEKGAPPGDLKRAMVNGDAMDTLRAMLPQELGLKLESQKAPIEMVVIDHADKVPTAN